MHKRFLAGAVTALGLLLFFEVPAASTRPGPPPQTPAAPRPAPSPARKQFALLVGINNYLASSEVRPLKGTENDVELMRKVLVGKFRFPNNESAVKTLVGSKATKKNILDAFKSFLIENAKSNRGATRDDGPVVVFYFSGHGSQADDVDKDEPDGYDETLVAYDSRSPGVADITDDELGALFTELSSHTSNVTFILDSCHSGTAMRSLSAETLVREVPPPREPGAPAHAVFKTTTPTSRDAGNGILSRSRSYVTLSSCLSYENAVEMPFDTPQGRKQYGALTYYLAQQLERTPNASYQEILKNVSSAIGDRLNQHPQAEGDVNRIVFGAASDREDAALGIVGAVAGGKFTIDAGAVQGIREGAFIAVYRPEVRRLVGQAGRLASARVTRVDDVTSVAELAENPPPVIPAGAKVAVVTPNFGGARLRVAFDAAGASPRAASLLSETQTALRDNTLVQPVADGSRSVVVKRGQFGVIKDLLSAAPASAARPPDDAEVVYITKADLDRPLGDFWVTPAQAGAADSLRQRLEMTAKQENLRAIWNSTSPINGMVELTVLRVEGERRPSGFNTTREEALEADRLGTAAFALGQHYRFRITNTSDQRVFVNLLVLATSGNVWVLNEEPNGVELNPGASVKVPSREVLQAGPPLGVETYKVFATSVGTNFRFLESMGAAPKNIGASPLQWLLEQAGSGMTRDPVRLSDIRSDAWTTAQKDLLITAR